MQVYREKSSSFVIILKKLCYEEGFTLLWRRTWFVSPCAFTNESVSILATEFPQLHLRLHPPILVIKLISLHQGRDLRSSHAIYSVIRNLARGEISSECTRDELFSATSIFKSSPLFSLSFSFRVWLFGKNRIERGENPGAPSAWFLFFIPGQARKLVL